MHTWTHSLTYSVHWTEGSHRFRLRAITHRSIIFAEYIIVLLHFYSLQFFENKPVFQANHFASLTLRVFICNMASFGKVLKRQTQLASCGWQGSGLDTVSFLPLMPSSLIPTAFLAFLCLPVQLSRAPACDPTAFAWKIPGQSSKDMCVAGKGLIICQMVREGTEVGWAGGRPYPVSYVNAFKYR